MEIIFEFIFSIFGEIILQIIAELLVEVGLNGLAEIVRPKYKRSAFFAIIGYGILGSIVGGLSLLVFPDLLLENKLHAVGNIIVTPILAGLMMSIVGQIKTKRGKDIIRMDSFLFGFTFAISMALTRYFFR